MFSRRMIFWEVDTQVDFMLPGGKLYVPGAEKLLPNLDRLTDAARRGEVFLVSDACIHAPDDPEFQQFPPHCLRGTPGAAIVPEALAKEVVSVPNEAGTAFPSDLTEVQQVVLEKQTFDVFDNPNTDLVLQRLDQLTDKDAEFVVFGVVTEYCVRCAAKGLLERGRRVSLVSDAIATLKAEDGEKALGELAAIGAKMITTDEALARVKASAAGRAAQ